MLFMSFFSRFLYFEHMCLKNITFNKNRGFPVILSKKKTTFGRFILNKESWKWVFVKGNLFSNKMCFFLLFLLERSWNGNVSNFRFFTVPQNYLQTDSYKAVVVTWKVKALENKKSKARACSMYYKQCHNSASVLIQREKLTEMLQQKLNKVFISESSGPSKKLLLFNVTVFGITIFRFLFL